jgi:hypothetical protein
VSDKSVGKDLPDKSRSDDHLFGKAVVYHFPLHVAQLRNDAVPDPAGTISLLPKSIVPLTFRETTPPADQVPAVRPQMTSPVVEATMSNLLDTIHHDDITAVGIIATDSRDVLFLAREVKKAAPDVQLFMTGAYALYLHPDYIPYTRGAIVATPYPLALAEQRRLSTSRIVEREPFPSMIAAGIFNATLLQLGRPGGLVDYCDPAAFTTAASRGPTACRPPVWATVIGDDGYWPLAAHAGSTALEQRVRVDAEPGRQRRVTTPAALAIGSVILVLGGLAWVVGLTLRSNGRFDRRLSGIPLLSVLVTPASSRRVALLHTLGLIVFGLLLAAVAFWMVSTVVLHAGVRQDACAPRAAWAIAAAVSTALLGACIALARWQRKQSAIGDDRHTPFAAQQRTNQLLMLICFLAIAGAIGCFVGFAIGTLKAADSVNGSFDIARFIGGGIVSPAAAVLCLFGALLTATFSGLRRLSLIGIGYAALAHRSPAFRLLSGAPRPACGGELSAHPLHLNNENQDLQRFAATLDMPMQNLPQAYLIAIGVLVTMLAWQVGWVSAIDGWWFSRFLTLASWSALVTALLLAAQGAYTWTVLRPKLERLSHTRLADPLGTVGHLVPWDLSITQPRLSELMPIAERAERIRYGLVALAYPRLDSALPFRRERRALNAAALNGATSQVLLVRAEDVNELSDTFQDRPAIELLREEVVNQKSAPLLASKSWRALWQIADRLVVLLEDVHWRRCRLTNRSTPVDSWFAQCEEFVAVQYAFVVRDVLGRITSSLFASMLVLTLLTAAHLFYLFQGRASLLTVDLVAIIVMGLVAIHVVVAMERDVIISKLRSTTPGRIDFNWSFVRQVATYGFLPLIAVVASLFPEVGGSLFGWLDPLRKLVAP